MSVTSRRFRETRRRLGLKQADLAATLGVTQGTISRWENGVSPDFSAMVKLAELAGFDAAKFALSDDHPFSTSITQVIDVIGAIGSDRWSERPEWDESQNFEIAIPVVEGWPQSQLEAFFIEDASAEPEYPQGSIIFCAPFHGDLSALQLMDRVVVVDENERGLFRLFVARVVFGRSGQLLFVPLPDVPAYARLDEKTPATQQIRGVVLGSFRVERSKYPDA